MVTEAELAQAEQAGRWARDACRSRESAPRYEMGQDGVTRRRRWQAGWDKRNQELIEERRSTTRNRH
ncbi:hypothetical protein WJ66_00444 [Stenotrophomonas maltophilia WJ66]|nr:hypothetical protein WJ66_00444 [Stenotrophomonas maltophilia WJ66]